MNKILQSDMFMKTWMWNGRILCFVALNIAMNLSDHLCSAEASTNGEFHLHNAKRKQYSSILHSLSHKLWNCNILNIHSIEIRSENPSIHVTSGRTQYRHSFHNREFHNANCITNGHVKHTAFIIFSTSFFLDNHITLLSYLSKMLLISFRFLFWKVSVHFKRL